MPVQHIGSSQQTYRDDVFGAGEDELDPGIPAQEAHLLSILLKCDPDLTVACPWCMQSGANAFLGDCMLQPILMCLFILSTPSLSPAAGAQSNHFDYEND